MEHNTPMTPPPWSISIKTVGRQQDATDGKDSFTVKVSPEDDMTCLHDQIEGVTGLKASQQRLIYRGRLLAGTTVSSGAEEQSDNIQKIGDVAGLGDGQTIHLVPKRASEPSTPTSTPAENANPASEDNNGSLSGSGTASLLAALLGLGSSDDDDDEDNTEETSSRRRGQRERLRTTRSSRSSRRQVNYRLTAQDIVPPAPGPMEPVRQGLMTLHTMLHPSQGESVLDNSNNNSSSPLDADRRWYRGQWIDCLDTVNQWLEATIVDVVRAEDVLPPRLGGREPQVRPRSSSSRTTDPAVSANDFEGRRRLLLEPCDENDSDGEDGLLSGFRERGNNRGVELLLVHYNGWPHRWDEWLRSDSERIRPFRTRTRHPSSAPYASPSPQSVFHAAPATHILDEDDDMDRRGLLPELSRVVSCVNDILAEATTTTSPGAETSAAASPLTSSSHTPWLGNGSERETGETATRSRPQLTREQLETLAPLLDRLGRTLTDAAPHVAALSQNLPEERSSSSHDGASDSNTAVSEENAAGSSSVPTGLFSQFTRRRRVSDSNADASTPLLASENTSTEGSDENRAVVDPDHADFVNGMVNTHRGDGRSGGRRGQSDDGAGLLGAYLAAASLSNLANGGGDEGGGDNGNNRETGGTLGRLLRQGGTGGGGGGGGGGGRGGGPGIDIHIHAIVTGPGVGPTGALGLAMMGGGGTPPPERARPSSSNRTETETASQQTTPRPLSSTSDNDDMGLFSDLYSESPQPTNLHGHGSDSENRESASSLESNVDTESDETPRSTGPSASETRSSALRGSETRSSSQRSAPRRGSSFGRILRRALGGGRRSSRSDRTND